MAGRDVVLIYFMLACILTNFGECSTSLKILEGWSCRIGHKFCVCNERILFLKIHCFFQNFIFFTKIYTDWLVRMINLLLILICYWRGSMWKFKVNFTVWKNVQIWEKTNQKKLRIWKLLTQLLPIFGQKNVCIFLNIKFRARGSLIK